VRGRLRHAGMGIAGAVIARSLPIASRFRVSGSALHRLRTEHAAYRVLFTAGISLLAYLASKVVL
jgi:hypothetical protein